MQKEHHKLCNHCGGHNNPSFQSCWKCNAPFELSETELSSIQADKKDQKIKSVWSALLVYTMLAALLGYLFIPSLLYQFRNSWGKKRTTVDRIAFNNYSFEHIPTGWQSIEIPPHPVRIIPPEIPESLALSFHILKGTKFVAIVGQKDAIEPQRTEIGIIAVIEKKSERNAKFKSITDPILEQMARTMTIGEKNRQSHFWRNVFPSLKNEVTEEVIAGNKWKIFTSVSDVVATNYHLAIYWTVPREGVAVFVLTETFDPFSDQITAQTRQFIESYKVLK